MRQGALELGVDVGPVPDFEEGRVFVDGKTCEVLGDGELHEGRFHKR